MTILEKCEWCDTALLFELPTGKHVRFTAHDDDYCKNGQRIHVKVLQDIIRANASEKAQSEWRYIHLLERSNLMQDNALIALGQVLRERPGDSVVLRALRQLKGELPMKDKERT